MILNLRVIIFLCLVALTACQGHSVSKAEQTKYEQVFSISSVAKTDLDMVFDYQVRTLEQHLKTLMSKLYLRNPVYWRSSGFKSANARANYVFSLSDRAISKALYDTRSIDSIQLTFDPAFGGDRVMAFVFGLKSMLHDAYGGRREFYILDQLDPQKLYNAARNLEVAVWKLSNDHKTDGQLYLVSNELDGQVKNLSFERLFGKMIALQDSSAGYVADSTNRVIKNVIQGVARYVFLPI